jgi:CBS domain containing-hemolysin-like protein
VRAIAEATAAVVVAVGVTEAIEGTIEPIVVAIAIMVVVSFALVGVSPRTLGRQHCDQAIALAAAPVVVALRGVLGPVARLLVGLGNAVTPGKGYRDGPFRSEAELRDLVDLARESALIEAEEREMLHSVFDLGDTLAREVMVPRTDMITIEADKPARKAINLFIRSGFSRVPVVGESTDDIVGLLYLKDVIRRTTASPEAGATEVAAFMRPAPFVPESKPIDDLLREMQRDSTHAAIVVDEYGGTAGLITIEDILEEIVGEIDDEYDRETPGVEVLDDGTVRVPRVDARRRPRRALRRHPRGGRGRHRRRAHRQGGRQGADPRLAGRGGGPGLTAEKMSGRRHRVASVIVERLADADEQQEEAS